LGTAQLLAGNPANAQDLELPSVEGHAVRFVIRGLPSRSFTMHAQRAPSGTCSSWVETSIAGVTAHIAEIFVQQKLLGVDFVLLSGWSQGGTQVQERVSP
jgi:hypothetical protein